MAVDDDPTMLDLLQEVLKPQGYEVLSAANGEEALAMAVSHRNRIDLLLTDVVLPGMKGQDLARQLTSMCPEVNVLFMSGYLCPSMAIQNSKKRYDAFIQKPFSPNELLRKIRKLMD